MSRELITLANKTDCEFILKLLENSENPGEFRAFLEHHLATLQHQLGLISEVPELPVSLWVKFLQVLDRFVDGLEEKNGVITTPKET